MRHDRNGGKSFWFTFRIEQSGSITLDATLVFPVIVLITFLILFYALYTSLHATVYYQAAISDERAAFNWSNSAKDWRTGSYPAGEYDGLYWRLSDDGMLKGLFGLEQLEGASELSFPVQEASASADSLVLRKLSVAGNQLGKGLQGTISYKHGIMQRELAVSAASLTILEPLRRFRGSATAAAEPQANGVEPVEWIRTFDLLRYYAKRMKNASEGQDAFRKQAQSVLKKRLKS